MSIVKTRNEMEPSIVCQWFVSQQNNMEVIMKKNVGFFERLIRIVAGILIMSNIVIGLETPWAWLGIIPLATGLIGWCPPYSLLGISTCPKCNSDDSAQDYGTVS